MNLSAEKYEKWEKYNINYKIYLKIIEPFQVGKAFHSFQKSIEEHVIKNKFHHEHGSGKDNLAPVQHNKWSQVHAKADSHNSKT